MTHILLQEGDIIKEGDECFNDGERWVGVMEPEIGKLFRTRTLRPMRRLATKSKVSLEELVKRVYAHCDVSGVRNVGQSCAESIVKSICAHLGIEIEEPKEEWQRVYEEFLKTNQGEKWCPSGQGFELAKAMFEAGQRSKEK